MTFWVTLLASGIAVRFEDLDVARDHVLWLPHSFLPAPHTSRPPSLSAPSNRERSADGPEDAVDADRLLAVMLRPQMPRRTANAPHSCTSLCGLTVDGQGVIHRVNEVSVLERLLEAGHHEVLYADEAASRL